MFSYHPPLIYAFIALALAAIIAIAELYLALRNDSEPIATNEDAALDSRQHLDVLIDAELYSPNAKQRKDA